MNPKLETVIQISKVIIGIIGIFIGLKLLGDLYVIKIALLQAL